jgi:hypothetical protein
MNNMASTLPTHIEIDKIYNDLKKRISKEPYKKTKTNVKFQEVSQDLFDSFERLLAIHKKIFSLENLQMQDQSRSLKESFKQVVDSRFLRLNPLVSNNAFVTLTNNQKGTINSIISENNLNKKLIALRNLKEIISSITNIESKDIKLSESVQHLVFKRNGWRIDEHCLIGILNHIIKLSKWMARTSLSNPMYRYYKTGKGDFRRNKGFRVEDSKHGYNRGKLDESLIKRLKEVVKKIKTNKNYEILFEEHLLLFQKKLKTIVKNLNSFEKTLLTFVDSNRKVKVKSTIGDILATDKKIKQEIIWFKNK